MQNIRYIYVDVFMQTDEYWYLSGPTGPCGIELPQQPVELQLWRRGHWKPVRARGSSLVDHFLSVFDERRLKRVWQNSTILECFSADESEGEFFEGDVIADQRCQISSIRGEWEIDESSPWMSRQNSNALLKTLLEDEEPLLPHFRQHIARVPLDVTVQNDEAVNHAVLVWNGGKNAELTIVNPIGLGQSANLDVLFRGIRIGRFHPGL